MAPKPPTRSHASNSTINTHSCLIPSIHSNWTYKVVTRASTSFSLLIPDISPPKIRTHHISFTAPSHNYAISFTWTRETLQFHCHTALGLPIPLLGSWARNPLLAVLPGWKYSSRPVPTGLLVRNIASGPVSGQESCGKPPSVATLPLMTTHCLWLCCTLHNTQHQ